MILIIFLPISLITCQKSLELNDSLTFFALGDWGGTNSYPYTTPAQLKIAEQMKKNANLEPISFIISTGDNFYPNGILKNDPRFEYTFKKVYLNDNSSLERIPWYIVLGNHDHRLGRARNQLEYTKINDLWIFPDFIHTLKVNLNNDSIKFIFIDTIILCNLYEDGPMEKMYDSLNITYYNLLEKELINSKNDSIKIVVGHNPIYTKMFGRVVPECIGKHLKSLLDRYQVRIYLSGHDHTLQHHVYKNKYSQSDTNLFVTGGGSSIYYLPMIQDDDDEKNIQSKFYWKKSQLNGFDLVTREKGGFSQFKIDKNGFSIKFIDSDGNVLYNSSINF
ncbi:unnamed protein product [Brachionus calyciflorus]|uniref:Calcineurin-like phosphoesterase domain-containing protein n=1 Tax=Brachionus calyciflorus TaxID=104777 RepID=A0A813XCD0_9BILA|nr:unnamed protein product [Brachionus calyciflorus]